jgi:CubicO group peptidase (beta-lactamase class C family)
MNRRRFLQSSLLATAACRSRFLWAAADDDAPESLHDLLDPLREKHALPALAAVVSLGGKVVGLGAVGVRKLGDETPVTAGDKFHLGSCTKAMTATLAATFVEEGRINWNSTLADVFADLKDAMHADYRGVTLEQLLQHRAGFSTETDPEAGALWTLLFQGKLKGTLREQRHAYSDLVLREAPIHPPGSKFAYSNRSYVVAGAMLEQVADGAWEDLLRKGVFEPLQMTTAGFGPMATPKMIDQPWSHRERDGKLQPVDPGPFGDNPLMLGPAGTVHCSPGDWAKFLMDHLRGARGDVGLLKPETYTRLHTPPEEGDYACGWGTVERDWAGGRALTHGGSNSLNFCTAWLAPQRDFAAAVMTNSGRDAASEACNDVVGKLIRKYLPAA